MVDQSIIQKAKKVKILLLDVDGVLTDGRIVYDSGGRNSKFYDVHDGMGVHLLYKSGIPTVLISAKNLPPSAPAPAICTSPAFMKM